MVRQKFKVSKKEIMESRRGQLNPARNIAIYLSWELSGLRQREIAEYFKMISFQAVAVQHFRVKKQAEKDKALSRLLDKLKSTCIQERT